MGYWIIEWEEEDGSHYEKVVASDDDARDELDTGDYPDNASIAYVNEPYRHRVGAGDDDELLAEQGGDPYI